MIRCKFCDELFDDNDADYDVTADGRLSFLCPHCDEENISGKSKRTYDDDDDVEELDDVEESF